MSKPRSSGDIPLNDGHTFRWRIQGDRTPEIYGWIEKDYSLVPATGGWWRTADPDEAARRAAATFNFNVEQENA